MINKKIIFIIAILFITFVFFFFSPKATAVIYENLGYLISTDLLADAGPGTIILEFIYNASAIPAGTTLKVQFSKDGTTWYSPSGVLNAWYNCTVTGGEIIDLSGLGWPADHFYYKMEFASTIMTATPVLEEIQLHYVFSYTPCEDHNIYGWAWSENIGWLSFSCKNCDTDDNGYIDAGFCGGDNVSIYPVDYGLDIEEDKSLSTYGEISGFVWSNQIGWIDFDPIGPYPQLPNYSAESDTSGNLSGWARACNVFQANCSGALKSDLERGGWDGWINLDGINFSSHIETSLTPSEFEGWAWGSDVVGWISFNCSNQGVCGSSDYKVMTSIIFNNPPIVQDMLISSHTCCKVGPKTCQIGFQWTYRDDDGDPEERFDFQVSDDIGFTAPIEIKESYSDVSLPDQEPGESYYETGNAQIVYVVHPPASNRLEFRGNNNALRYYWRVRVWDDQGNNSGWVNGPTDFQTEKHAWPLPDFDLIPIEPVVNEVATTTNSSLCFDIDNNDIPCDKDAWTWSLSDGEFVSPTINTDFEPLIKFLTAGDEKEVTLRVEDNSLGINKYCEKTKEFTIRLPLPIWIETKPD